MPDAADPIATILRSVPATDAVRASAWDAYQSAANEDDLATTLKRMPLPQHVKAQLWDLKHAAGQSGRSWLDTATDTVKGAVAGAANTVFGGGDLIRRATGMPRIVNEPDVKAMMTPPDSTAGRVGFAGEQIGEFFLPTGYVGRGAKAVEALKSGAITLAQTGSPTQAGASAALTAVLPGASAATRASGALEQSAQKEMAQALGATKEWAKAEATKLAPQMLDRGVGGSREAMLGVARETAARVGQNLDDAYRAAAQAGETVSGDIIRGNLQLAADALKVQLPNGTRSIVPGTERVIARLDKLDEFVAGLGPDIPVDVAAKLKRTWDHIVSKSGLYGAKATASATDNADSWALREASTAFRDLLNTNPTIEALNKEASFWTGLKKVLSETQKRTQAQSGGLVAAGSGGAGAVVGAMTGDSPSERTVNALVGGLAGRQLVKLVQSPAWRTQVSGPMKQMLADALASGSGGRAASVTSRIIASLPAQLRPSFAP